MSIRTTFTTNQHRATSITNELILDSTITELKFDTNLNGKILLSNVARSWLVNQSAGGYKLISLASGVDATDAVNMSQLTNGLALKLDKTQLMTYGAGDQQIDWASVNNDTLIPTIEAVKRYFSTTSVAIVGEELPGGAMDGVNMEYTLAQTPMTGSVVLYLNGIRLKYGLTHDYTVSGSTITMTYPPLSTDLFVATYTYSGAAGGATVISFSTVIDFGHVN
jgi:hypothetical protein